MFASGAHIRTHAQIAEDSTSVHRQRRTGQALDRFAPIRTDEHAVLVDPYNHLIQFGTSLDRHRR